MSVTQLLTTSTAISATITSSINDTTTTTSPINATTPQTNLADNFTIDKIVSTDGLYYTFAVFAPLTSFCLFLRYYWLSKKKHVALSYQLKVHLLAWLVSLIFDFSFFITIWPRYFTPPELEYSELTSELIRGLLHIASTNTIPLSTFFLLLDRIFAVSFLGARLDKWRRHSQWISTTCITLLFVTCVCVLIWRTVIFPPNTSSTCTFSCRMNDAIKDLLLVKLVISIMNVICGSVFAFLYIRHARHTAFKREKKLNYTVLLVFITELCCNIIPTSTYLIFSQTDFFRSIRISTMITVGHDFDGLTTAILYWYTRSGRNSVKSLVVNAHLSKVASSSTIKVQRTCSTAISSQRPPGTA